MAPIDLTIDLSKLQSLKTTVSEDGKHLRFQITEAGEAHNFMHTLIGTLKELQESGRFTNGQLVTSGIEVQSPVSNRR